MQVELLDPRFAEIARNAAVCDFVDEPNGLAFSPDESHICASSSLYRIRLNTRGAVTS